MPSTYLLRYLPKLVGLTGLYLLLAWLVILLFSSNEVVDFLWPACGLGLAVVLLGGRKYLPAVFLGALLGQLLLGLPLGFAIGIALCHTVSIFIGIELLQKGKKFNPALQRLNDFSRIFVIALG